MTTAEAESKQQKGPIKVCYVARSTQGGAAISLQTLACNLDRSRFSPIVLFHEIKNPDVVARLEAHDIPVHALLESRGAATRELKATRNTRDWLSENTARRKLVPLYNLCRAARDFLRDDLKLVRRQVRFFREQQPDIIHFNNGLRGHRAGILACRKLDIPCVCHVRGYQFLTPLERLIGKKVRRLLYISRAIQAHYEGQKIASGRGQVIHNVVTLPPVLSDADKQKVRSEFGYDGNHLLAVNAGRIVGWKGQDVCLKAVREVVPDFPNLRCLIVGEPDETPRARAFSEDLKRMVAEFGIAENVVFTGLRSDVAALMATADVVVHSATKPEPFGRVIIEAMATGTPVIAANAGGVTDIIAPGENGLVFAPGDPLDLASALSRLASSPELREAIGAAGFENVNKNFNVAKHARSVEKVYLESLGR